MRSVLMVCMGNICRSPTAEAVLRHRLDQQGLGARIEVDSAGTHAHHIGHAPDGRAVSHAAHRGYSLDGLRARRINPDDFQRFDLILAMDHDNLGALRQRCPAELHSKLRRLMEFAPAASKVPDVVPDPYYGGAAGFEKVLDLIELGCDGLVEFLRSQQGSMPDPASGLGPGKPE